MLDLANRIELPIYSDEGIIVCVNHCLEKGVEPGQKTHHSRFMRLSNYRECEYSESITEQDKHDFICQMLRYLSKSLFLEFSSSKGYINNNDELIIDDYPEFIMKNPELKSMKIKQLYQVSCMSDEELLSHLRRGITTMDKYIRKAYESVSLWDYNGDYIEHVFQDPIYNYIKSSDREDGFWSGGGVYSKRIYMNGAADKRQLEFIKSVLKKCIDKRIPCDMKPMFGASTALDGTIYYGTNANFHLLVEAIDESIEEHPELLGCFGSPIITGANVRSSDGNCYYAISHGGANLYDGRSMGTFNDVADRIINATYTLACLRIIKDYFPMICNECPREIAHLMNVEVKTYDELRLVQDKSYAIREIAYKVISNTKEAYNKLVSYFKSNLGIATSLINFGDLDHCDVPMYKDACFLRFEQQKKI